MAISTVKAGTNYRIIKLVNRIFLYSILTFGTIVVLIPFLFMISNSLKSLGETITRVSANPFSPLFWPSKLKWDNFTIVIREGKIGRYFLNSLILVSFTISGILITSSLAAYGFSKLKFAGRDIIFSILISTLMIPQTVLLIPNFLIVSRLGWLNRLPALTVPFMASAFFIFLLRQFFNQIPNALVESARMDGGSHLRILLNIILPLTKAPLFTVAFLAFNSGWNSLQWPLIVTMTDKWRPIAVGLTKLLSEAGPNTQLRMAGAIIAMLPTTIVYLIAQRQITEAVTSSGIKG